MLVTFSQTSNVIIGCVYSLKYKSMQGESLVSPGYPAGLVEAGRNVQQCQRKECDVYTCLNGGTCEELGASFR